MTRPILLCVGIFLLAGFIFAEDKTPRTIKGWGTVNDPEGDCTIAEKNGTLSVSVPAGIHDLNAAAGGMHAPRILQEIEGDFSIRVKVTGDFQPGENPAPNSGVAFVSAGLLLWHNERNFVRLERDLWWAADTRKYVCYPPLFEYYRGGDNQNTNPDVTAEEFFRGRSTWLRLDRHGDTLAASYTRNGKDWVLVKEITVDLPQKLQIGVAAINTSAKTHAVEFSDLKIARK
jgi:hypothetical protein